jgi:ATPase subunit of ABC transporter with duplicated ATPase domains
MRIAVTGTHGVGKTTLVEDLTGADTQFEVIAEPFIHFQSDGAFVDGPNTEDFDAELNRSCDLILDWTCERPLSFDRSPHDYIAYLEVLSEAESCEWAPSAKQLARFERALQTLDLLVFVPLLDDDEIAGTIEYPKLRRAIDVRLESILSDDELGLSKMEVPVVEVSGGQQHRVLMVIESMPSET